MRIAASIRISRTSPAAPRWLASARSGSISSPRSAARRPTPTPRARLFPQLKPEDVVAQGRAALAFLKARPDTTGKVGAVGFCWGGGAVNDLAVSAPELNAGVVFYGRSPDLAKVPQIKARLLIQQAARDTRLVESLPPMRRR
jgi:dienelactone hydrolase